MYRLPAIDQRRSPKSSFLIIGQLLG